MKIYLATWIGDPKHGACLTAKEANERLLSFYFIKEQRIKHKQLLNYFKTVKL